MADITSKVIFGLDPSEFRRGIQQVDSKLKQVSNQFNNLGGLIGATFAVTQLTAFGKELVELGSQMQSVSSAFRAMSAPGDIERLREATRGMTTDLDLMKMANQARSVGIEMSTLAEVMRYVSRYAKATGQDMNNLMSDATQELVKQTGLRLDQLGISISDVRQRTADGMPFVNAVLAEMADNMKNLGEETDTASDKIQRFNTSWTNWKTSVGESLAGPLAAFLDWTVETAKYFNLLMKVMNQLSTFGTRTALGIKQGGAAPAAPTGGGGAPVPQVPVQSIALLRENLEALKKEFETVQIGSARFQELKKQIEEANYQLGRATGDIWPGGKEALIKLNKLGLEPFNINLQTTGTVLKSVVLPAMESTIGTVDQIRESMDRFNTQMQFLTAVGAEFGHIFSSSFNAAMENGTNFFEELGMAIKNYIQQMLIALGVTAALALVFSSITKGLTFGDAFKAVSKGTGLGSIFGEGGIIELFTTIKGFDLQANSNRVNGVLNITR